MHYSYSLVIKTIKIKNTAFFNSRSIVPMWFMSVASKEMHDSFSAAKLFCCTITLLLKIFTDYHHIYSLWTLNASLRQDKTQVFEKNKQNFSLILQKWFPQDWSSFWMEKIWTGSAVLSHARCSWTPSSMCQYKFCWSTLLKRNANCWTNTLETKPPPLRKEKKKKKTNRSHLFHFLHPNPAL